MNKCTYCGKEYPDDATVCAIDAQPLGQYEPNVSNPPNSDSALRPSLFYDFLSAIAAATFTVGAKINTLFDSPPPAEPLPELSSMVPKGRSENDRSMKGVILGLDPENSTIVILGSDDKRYRLAKSEWKSAREHKVGMTINFVTEGDDFAREAYNIPRTVENPISNKQRIKHFFENLRILSLCVFQYFWTQLPATLRNGRALVLFGVLLSIVAALIVHNVTDQIQKAKWEREAPQRAINDSAYYGRNAGITMCQAGLATDIWRATTESEVSQLAYYVWANPNDTSLKSICGGSIRSTGYDYETQDAQQAFVNAFIQSYISEIDKYKQRNQQLY